MTSHSIGKTALVSRFVSDLRDRARVLWGTCDDLSIPRPLAPLTDLAGDVAAELRAALTSAAGRARVHALMLAELPGLPPPTYWRMCTGRMRPPLTLVTVIGRLIASLPAVLILSFREGEVSSGDPLWASLGSLPADRSRHLRLGPLSRAAVSTLAGHDTERVYALTPSTDRVARFRPV